jgi:hypothetical protein
MLITYPFQGGKKKEKKRFKKNGFLGRALPNPKKKKRRK